MRRTTDRWTPILRRALGILGAGSFLLLAVGVLVGVVVTLFLLLPGLCALILVESLGGALAGLKWRPKSRDTLTAANPPTSPVSIVSSTLH